MDEMGDKGREKISMTVKDLTDKIEDLIETNLSGPHTPESTGWAASTMYRLTRLLVYATRPENRFNALPYACDGCRLSGSLRDSAELLQQGLRQFAEWADELGADPALGHDDHRGEEIDHLVAAENAAAAAKAFRAAIPHAIGLAGTLARAQAALLPLHHSADQD